jgi:hypothetical protein
VALCHCVTPAIDRSVRVVKQSYSSLQTLYKSYINDHRSAVLHHLRACEQDTVIMSLGKILRKAVTHLTSSEPRRRLDDVLRQCRHPGRGDQYLIDIVDLGSTHLYRSSQILVKIRLGSVMRDIRELREQIIRYAEWASGLLPSVEKQCSELFTWIKVTSSLSNTELVAKEHLEGVAELHRASAEIRTNLKRIGEAPYLLQEIEATLDKLCTCENNLSEQTNLRKASQIERLVDPLITPVQDANLSQASLHVNRRRRPIKGSGIVIDDYIEVSHEVDLIFELCKSLAAVLRDLDHLLKTSQHVIEPL